MTVPGRAALSGSPEGVLQIGVSITVPEPYGSVLQEARARVGDPAAPFIRPHITLVGPTAVAPGDLVAVEQHLTAVAGRHRPFVVHLRGTGSFRPVSPVVFVQVVEGIAMCERLEADVRSDRLAQDLRFHYHPHVTVAHELDDAGLDRAFDELADFEARFVVHEIEAYEHGADGVWRLVGSYALTGRGDPALDLARDAGRAPAS